MYDAVQLLARALTDLDSLQVILLLLHSTMATMSTLGLQDLRLEPLSCESTDVWHDGDMLLGYLRFITIVHHGSTSPREAEHTGLTGEIRLDQHGFRTDFALDLMEKVRGRVEKTANWSPGVGVNYTLTATEVGTQMVEKLANKTLRVVTTPVSSYNMQ